MSSADPTEYVGCVAFLDILGFSEQIHGDNFKEVFGWYSEALEAVAGVNTTLGYAAFSDSIVIHTMNESSAPADEEIAFRALVAAVSHLMMLFLTRGVPLRGAISYGRFLRCGAGGNVIIAGRPIVDAYRYESQQEWVGVILSPLVVRKFPEIKRLGDGLTRRSPGGSEARVTNLKALVDNLGFIARCQRVDVPFKDHSVPFSGYGIVPLPLDFPLKAEDLMSFTHHLGQVGLRLKELRDWASDPRSQAKYRVSHEWIEVLVTNWSLYRLQVSLDLQHPRR